MFWSIDRPIMRANKTAGSGLGVLPFTALILLVR